MTRIIRFIVQVDPHPPGGWWAAILSPQHTGQEIGQKRLLRQLEGSGVEYFPIPPEDEPLPELAQGPAGEPDAGRLEEALEEINLRSAGPDILRLYGRYLFDTLIGPNWQAVHEAAQEAQPASSEDLLFELALRWPVQENSLHRLHWEAMHDGQRFLASLNRDPQAEPLPQGEQPLPLLPLAVTRLVPTGSSVTAPVPFPPPARVLFAMGVPVTDEKVRPGAEFIGFLRQLRLDEVEYQLHAHLLENVSPSMLNLAAAEYKPHVIHISSHGSIEWGKGPYLELAREEGQSGDEHSRLFAAGLLQQLGAFKPAVAVLSACYTAGPGEKPGRMMSGAATGPMASELVAGGIPIVVGMAGQVADLACRLFTRGFGGALARGDPLVLATARGRQAAFTPGIPTETWVDWAFPVIFLADSVPVDFSLLDRKGENSEKKINEWLANLRLGGRPVFCARQDLMQSFYSLFFSPRQASLSAGQPDAAVLVVKTPNLTEGLGRHRLLVEMSIEAVRSGHIPLLLSEDKQWEPPTNPLALAKRLHDQIVFLRTEVYRVGYEFWQRPRLRQVDLLYSLRDRPGDLEKDEYLAKLDPEVLQRSAGDGTEIPPAAIRAAIQIEISELLQDVRTSHPDRIGAGSRVIVLLNRVEDYQRALEALAVGSSRWLTLYGLGDAIGSGIVKEPVPVVMVYSYYGNKETINAADTLRSAFEEAVSQMGARTGTLKEFDRESGEDMMVYYRVLLHPFKEALHTGSKLEPLTVNPRLKPEQRAPYRHSFHYALRGIPALFHSDDFDNLISDLAKDEFLVPARDEDILQSLLQTQEAELHKLRQAGLARQAGVQAETGTGG